MSATWMNVRNLDEWPLWVGMLKPTTSWHYWEERNFAASREFGLDPLLTPS